MKERVEFIDLAKGFCIMLVVLHHAAMYAGFSDFDSYDILRNSRIPLYFCLSGIFVKSYGGFLPFLRKKTNKLLIPFVFFYILLSCGMPYVTSKIGLDYYGGYYGGINIFYHYFVADDLWFNGPIWFLLCLFVINVLYYPLAHLQERNTKWYFISLIISFICGSMGYLMYLSNIRNFCYIGTALVAMPFFSIGSILKNYSSLLNVYKKNKISLLVCAFLLLMLLIPIKGTANYHINKYEIPLWQCYYCGFIGLFSVLLISKALVKLPFISVIGRYSIITLCVHYEVQRFISLFLPSTFSSFFLLLLYFIGSMVICRLLIPVFCKCIPYFVAQKDLI